MSTGASTEGGGSSPGKRCAACKSQRRKCAPDCILAPYFPASDPQRYACVQRVFGASNVARILQNLPVYERSKAADTMAMEARRRVQDPVYGCAGIVGRIQGEIRAAQCELARTQAQIAVHAAAARAHRQQQAAVVDDDDDDDAQAQQAQAPLQLQLQMQMQRQQDDEAPFHGLDALLLNLEDYHNRVDV